LLWLGISAMPRPKVDTTTITTGGITFHLFHPPITNGTASVGTGTTKRGTAITWVKWSDGVGLGELLEFEKETVRLRIGDQDLGPIKTGDVVEYGFEEVVVNGRA